MYMPTPGAMFGVILIALDEGQKPTLTVVPDAG
jgi:hypothetical protein